MLRGQALRSSLSRIPLVLAALAAAVATCAVGGVLCTVEGRGGPA